MVHGGAVSSHNVYDSSVRLVIDECDKHGCMVMCGLVTCASE
jgi:hypothetical protein